MYYLLAGALGAASSIGWYLATGRWQMPYLVFIAAAVACSLIADVVEHAVTWHRGLRARSADHPAARHRKGAAR